MIKKEVVYNYFTFSQQLAYEHLLKLLLKSNTIFISQVGVASELYIEKKAIKYVIRVMELIGLVTFISTNRGIAITLEDRELLERLVEE